MEIGEYKKSLREVLKPRTLVFLLRENEVLLGLKKNGFGKGYIVGIGGKVEEKETIEEAAKREVMEEVHVTIPQLTHVGQLYFYFPQRKDESWNQTVSVFITDSWSGTVEETDEIKPMWVERQHIPYEKMWADAAYWLPQALSGKKVHGEFFFDEERNVCNYLFS